MSPLFLVLVLTATPLQELRARIATPPYDRAALERFADALEPYADEHAGEPEVGDLLWTLSHALVDSGGQDRARKVLERLADGWEEDAPFAELALASIAHEEGDEAAEVAALEAAYDLAPQPADAWGAADTREVARSWLDGIYRRHGEWSDLAAADDPVAEACGLPGGELGGRFDDPEPFYCFEHLRNEYLRGADDTVPIDRTGAEPTLPIE